MTDSREIAFQVLLAMDKKEASNSILKDTLDKYSYLDKQERSFIKRLTAGVTERRITLDYIADLYSKTPVRKMKPVIRTIVRMGIYQIVYMDQVPDSAAVNESVKSAKTHGFYNLSGFVNGLLRNVARKKDSIVFPDRNKDKRRYYSVFYSVPEWIVEMLLAEQGEQNMQTLLDNSLSVRKLTARVNLSRSSRDGVIEKIALQYGGNDCSNDGPKAEPDDLLPYAVSLHNIDRLDDIHSFNDGDFAVQDISSMLVGHIAGINRGDRVIDVCAAPGGKTMHAADLCPDGEVISCDQSESKISKIRENITRCAFANVSTVLADARVRREEYVDGFDVVIADVPCSGLGVMGRKGDIKYNIESGQLQELSDIQHQIIDNVTGYVKPGGTFMYSTCTVHRAENEDMARYIADKGFEAVDFYDELPDRLKKESAREGMLQLYGEDGLTDGFFIAKFRKIK